MSRVTVVKIGGSLADAPGRLREVLQVIAESAAPAAPIVVVPGGGPFADAVRAAQATHGFDDAAAHAMAMLAMAQYGLMLAAVAGPLLQPFYGADQVGRALAQGSTCAAVWLPQPAQDAPELRQSWDLTSDSLALWLAARLGADRLVLLKSSPQPAAADLCVLTKAGILDTAFPDMARRWPGLAVDLVFGASETALRAALCRAKEPSRRGRIQ
jgi:5-(aminomethyl)-3-furanmethanol phosphate kinase